MLSNEKIKILARRAEAEGQEGEIEAVLENTLTAGELIEILRQFDPSTPVEVEIPVEVAADGSMMSEAAYVVNVFNNPEVGPDEDVVTLQGCKPDMFEAYADWLEAGRELDA